MTHIARAFAASVFERRYAIGLLLVFCAMPFVVGDQPQGAESLNPVAYLENVSTKGDQIKQLILLSLYGGCAVLLLLRTPARAYLFLGAPLILLTTWCFLSCAWSVDPSVTVRRCVALLGTVVLGLFLGLRFDLGAMLRLLSWLAAVILVGSLILAVLSPSLGLDFEGRLRGVFAHKNAMGSFAAMAFMIAAARLSEPRQQTGRLIAAMAALAPVAVFCMAAAQSAGVIPVVAAGLGALLIARFVRAADGGMLALVPVLLCVGIGGFRLILSNSGSLVELVGKDPDLSGRTLVWEFVEGKIAEAPWGGYGFGAFWVGDNSPGAAFWQISHLGVPHAHNGYLQLLLDAGGVGLLLIAAALAATAFRVFRLLRYSREPFVGWALALLGCYVVTNLDESALWLGNELLIVLFIYISVRINVISAQEAGELRLLRRSEAPWAQPARW